MKKTIIIILLSMFFIPINIYAEDNGLYEYFNIDEPTKEEIIEKNIEGAKQNAKDNTIKKLKTELNSIKKENKHLKKQNKKLKNQKKIYLTIVICFSIVILYFLGIIILIRK